MSMIWTLSQKQYEFLDYRKEVANELIGRAHVYTSDSTNGSEAVYNHYLTMRVVSFVSVFDSDIFLLIYDLSIFSCSLVGIASSGVKELI